MKLHFVINMKTFNNFVIHKHKKQQQPITKTKDIINMIHELPLVIKGKMNQSQNNNNINSRFCVRIDYKSSNNIIKSRFCVRIDK